MAEGTKWYSKYGALYQIIVGFILVFLYLILFTMMLTGCCLRKPKSEGILPVRPETEDEDVKAERDRVQNII